jgi:hypothetical protein
MSEKPSYLGLLNAISVGETNAGCYLAEWAKVTSSDDVRAVIHTVALRETEHGLAFEKRIDELGYTVQPRDDPKNAERMAIAASTALSDKEKFEALGLGKAPQTGASDIFDNFFENKDLDPVTGGLLGRYIAEERDSGRKFAACYAILCAEADKAAAKAYGHAKSNGHKGKGKARAKKK